MHASRLPAFATQFSEMNRHFLASCQALQESAPPSDIVDQGLELSLLGKTVSADEEMQAGRKDMLQGTSYCDRDAG